MCSWYRVLEHQLCSAVYTHNHLINSSISLRPVLCHLAVYKNNVGPLPTAWHSVRAPYMCVDSRADSQMGGHLSVFGKRQPRMMDETTLVWKSRILGPSLCPEVNFLGDFEKGIRSKSASKFLVSWQRNIRIKITNI